MAVDPDELDEIAATVADVYREAEVSLVRLIGRHLEGDIDRDIPAPQWATEKLAAVRALREGAQAVIAGLTADSSRAFAEAAAKAYRSGHGRAVSDLPATWFAKSGIGQAAREAQLGNLPGTAAVESLAAAVHRDVGERSSNILRDVIDIYRNVITAATARIVTGSQTRRQAAQAAWKRLTDRGITSFTDRSGRRWQLPSYVEMAARTVTQRAAVQGQTDRLEALDLNLVMVSNHGQECALCRPFEGRILSLKGPTGRIEVKHATRDNETVTVDVKATLDQARRDGFQHPNCRHSVSAYLPGVSKPAPQPTEDPKGDKARQTQRALERAIRREKLAEVGALTDEARKTARAKIRNAQTALRHHLDAHPQLKRLRYREQIGAGNIPPKGRNDPAGDIGPVTQPTLDGGTGAPVRRTPRGERVDTAEAQRQAEAHRPSDDQLDMFDQPEPEPTPASDPLDNLERFEDEDLDVLLAEHADDDTAIERILAEMDRRQAVADAFAEAEAKREANAQYHRDRRARLKAEREEAQWRRFEELLEQGQDEESAVAEVFGKSVERQRRDRAITQLRGQGYTGKGLDELARKAYTDHVYEQYIAAENATRGHLLTPEAQRAGIDPLTLFSGPTARARLHASDELKEWWDQRGRMTYDQWVDELLGNGPGFRGSAGDSWLQ